MYYAREINTILKPDIIARSALYFLCVRGPARTLVCCCLSLFFEKIYTEQRQGDHAFTAWCFDRNIQILRVSPVFGPVSSATYASYLRIEGPENGHFSLFLDQFHQRLRLHICGLRGPENGHISLFLDQFHQRLRLHICGLRGPEKGSVLTSGASRPCSAVECVMRCSLNENSTVRTFFGTLADNPTVGDYNVG